MSYEDAILKIQRIAREKSEKLYKESVATAVKLKALQNSEELGEFAIETHITSDKRIRFSAPREIKEKLKAGQKVRLEVKLFSKS